VTHATNSLTEAVATLVGSEKFRLWKPSYAARKTDGIERSSVMAVKHFTPEELADLWNVSTETIRAIFREEPGVLKIGKTGSKHKRGYVTLRIPEDVAERIHTRLSA
jgi:hypothetical protein